MKKEAKQLRMLGFFFNKINIVLNKHIKRKCGLKEILPYSYVLDSST